MLLHTQTNHTKTLIYRKDKSHKLVTRSQVGTAEGKREFLRFYSQTSILNENRINTKAVDTTLMMDLNLDHSRTLLRTEGYGLKRPIHKSGREIHPNRCINPTKKYNMKK